VAGRDLDIRVSTVPTAHGERVVMRLLDRSSTLLGLEELGFSGRNLAALRRLAHQSHGIVLVTGPTGSGKTTTLYATLAEINSVDKNILTIEDPIEYQLSGVGQMQVNPRIELTFAAGLRSILRQDPDVIMVGEIRDQETARIAIQAALTGHLVLSTLHTNDSFSAVTRLLDMGIEPFLVSSSVIGILAQRLVRKVCRQCSRKVSLPESGLAELGASHAAAAGSDLRVVGAGCEACRNSGYRGRTVIAELLTVDDAARAFIMQRADAATLREACTARGMPTVRDDGADKVRRGMTSVAEVLRVTAVDAE
jgi:general secretion pathway protein E